MERVVNVIARDDFSLELTFDNGEVRLFDARPYLEKGLFVELKDPDRFRQAHVAYDTVCWPGRLDIAPETLYDRSVLLREGSDLIAAEPSTSYPAGRGRPEGTK
jgi:hypothetical protein